MMTYRFKFSKGEEIKFIGHLDIVQAFQRSIKRADLPIAYSNGFNPHQQIDFASPLSLGYVSEGEYGDLKLTQDLEPKEVMERLNAVLPDGMVIKELIRRRDGVKNTMASVSAGRYKAYLDSRITPKMVEENLENYFALKEIIVMKKTKKNFKETDIKPDIFQLINASEGESAIIEMVIAAGSTRNLKPESVAEGFYNFVGVEYNKFKIGFKRMDIYMVIDEKLVPLTYGVEF
ncbi:MAG: TIGR03936 family radical SAM-associated protein [Lachnospiraceae bacterium]|nr:TIGR03936 family radical SAM-associated protein [Lachnospiraceae bacterium]